MLAIFSISVLVSFFFTLDLLQTPKKGGFYLRNLIQVIAVSIPSIYKSMNNSQADFLVMWDRYFYCIFTASFFVFIILAYFLHYKKIINILSKYDDIEKEFSFLGFLQSGNKNFQDEINKLIKKSTNKKSKMTSTVFKSLGNTLPLYIRDLNLTLVDNNNNPDYTLIDYSYFVLESFISNFLSHSDARFSIREYDPETKSMVTIFSTRHEEEPSPIPLNKKNLILLSMKTNKPVIYSKNKQDHYDTQKSLKEKKYDDYVSYCILSDEKKNIPLLSANLDVKGPRSVKRMKVLVESSIFTIICDTIKIKSMIIDSKLGLCNGTEV